MACPAPCKGPQAPLSVKGAHQGSRTIRKLRFEPSRRLHQPAEFREVRTRGRRLSDALFSLSVLANHETHPRLGLAIATRTFGSAVARNRIKRITRESFRLNQHSLPAVDVTVAARDAARHATARDLRASLDQHWKSISKRW
ncbi:MAG: ribonuclease P protein component [Steroidobacteraceae bacterium]